MSSPLPRHLERIAYEEAAEAYLRSLPPEHFMEATGQATQREITLESLALVKARRPEVQVFNVLLVQYRVGRSRRPRQVVPDNMIVVWKEPIRARGSFDIPFQPVGPYCVLEYVSKNSKRKDYDKSFQKYERHLKVPYYLVFYPDDQELTVYRHTDKKYVSVKPNAQGQLAIPELELEVMLLDDWVRYWFRGELLPLPADLQRDLDKTRRERDTAQKERDEAQQQRDTAQKERDEAQQQRDEAQQQRQTERQARTALEEEVARLQARLSQLEKAQNLDC